MTPLSPEEILGLVGARHGHFRYESGLHGKLWLDLDLLFVDPTRVAKLAAVLASLLAPHKPDAICGPLVGGALVAQFVAAQLGCEMCFAERAADEGSGLYRARYRVPHGQRARLAGKRVAIVDDVISAGSSVRATFAELTGCGAVTVAAGCLLQMGEAATLWFAAHGIAVVACAKTSVEMWPPEQCPLCAAGVTLETMA